MVQFESLGIVSYSHSIVMAVSCIISETKRDIGRKSLFFRTTCNSALALGGSLSENCHTNFGTEKLELGGYSIVKKFFDMSSRFDTIPRCDGRT